MAIENAKESAFPNTWTVEKQGGSVVTTIVHGLTKREEFAKAAMVGFCSNESWAKTLSVDDWDEYADRLGNAAVKMADALLLELEKPV